MTVIQAGPCVVVDRREHDGGTRLQLGFVEPGRKVRLNRPMEGHFKRAGVPPAKPLKEFEYRVEEGEEEVKLGEQILVQDIFEANQYVDVSGYER